MQCNVPCPALLPIASPDTEVGRIYDRGDVNQVESCWRRHEPLIEDAGKQVLGDAVLASGFIDGDDEARVLGRYHRQVVIVADLRDHMPSHYAPPSSRYAAS